MPEGDILIVGNGQSGCQIAHELARSGRKVVMACGRAPWVPRRIGDRDLAKWILASGMLDVPASEIPPEARFAANAIATGQMGGYDLNLRVLRDAGVTLTGRFAGVRDGCFQFAHDLAESVAWSDAAQEAFREGMTKLANAVGWAVPEFPNVAPFEPTQPVDCPTSRIGSVIYGTGYRPAFQTWLPWEDALDDQGFPHQTNGSSSVVPGLHFLGMHLLRNRKSSLLAGVGTDAAILANTIAKLHQGQPAG
jgi:putative flavoprotein involved in K+ transport